jgi:hypothetical protein
MQTRLPDEHDHRAFVAIGDTTGKQYTLNVDTKIEVWLNSFTGVVDKARKLSKMTTSDGLDVDRTGKGVYELISTGEVLRSTEADPF